jgi:hypothetical protein
MADDAETVDLPESERLAFQRLLGSLHEDYHFDFHRRGDGPLQHDPHST